MITPTTSKYIKCSQSTPFVNNIIWFKEVSYWLLWFTCTKYHSGPVGTAIRWWFDLRRMTLAGCSYRGLGCSMHPDTLSLCPPLDSSAAPLFGFGPLLCLSALLPAGRTSRWGSGCQWRSRRGWHCCVATLKSKNAAWEQCSWTLRDP